MDTNPFAEREEAKLRRDPQIKAARTGNLAAVMRDEMKPNYFTHIADNQHLKDTCMDMALSLGTDVFINQSHALRARQDYSDVLRRVACPTLILCGRHDVLCPPERHHAMQDMIPHARLVIIDEAGHLPTLEVPEKVAAALDELLLMDAA
jgi:pimeloyl-ACP methyl ester carboxylesterase